MDNEKMPFETMQVFQPLFSATQKRVAYLQATPNDAFVSSQPKQQMASPSLLTRVASALGF